MDRKARARLARYGTAVELAAMPYEERVQVARDIRAALGAMGRLRFGFSAAMFLNALAWAAIVTWAAAHQ